MADGTIAPLLRCGFLCALFFAATTLARAQASSDTSAAPHPTPGQLNGKECLSVTEAEKQQNKDLCVTAHVFEVVELSNGTRFLDVCSADLPDDKCRFTLVSFNQDREEVGDLRRYRDQDVRIRGIIRATHGRMGIVISHARQFRGGPEKFRPNPKLARGFDGQSDRPPIHDPNLAAVGRHRAFMNSRDTVTLPAKSSR